MWISWKLMSPLSVPDCRLIERFFVLQFRFALRVLHWCRWPNLIVGWRVTLVCECHPFFGFVSLFGTCVQASLKIQKQFFVHLVFWKLLKKLLRWIFSSRHVSLDWTCRSAAGFLNNTIPLQNCKYNCGQMTAHGIIWFWNKTALGCFINLFFLYFAKQVWKNVKPCHKPTFRIYVSHLTMCLLFTRCLHPGPFCAESHDGRSSTLEHFDI